MLDELMGICLGQNTPVAAKTITTMITTQTKSDGNPIEIKSMHLLCHFFKFFQHSLIDSLTVGLDFEYIHGEHTKREAPRFSH
jgi:hypothetical protein